MNEITKAAVDEAAKRNPSMSKKAADGEIYWATQFSYKVMEEWGNLIFGNISWKLRARAEHIFKRNRPDMFDKDDCLDDYFDFTCFNPAVERIIERHVDNHPELQLENYDDFLVKLYPKQLEMF